MGDWISVKDHLPEDCLIYKGRLAINLLVTVKPPYLKRKPYVTKCQRKWDNWGDCWIWTGYKDEVTHWMPMPEPAMEDED